MRPPPREEGHIIIINCMSRTGIETICLSPNFFYVYVYVYVVYVYDSLLQG